ncbi:class C sortase [Gulosibacter faecalis]|uniref:Class C sortase n=1 Tax=Gulosibacter faecalis TaxID=272240 RepID=A0ABW5UXX5_9MICO|nr:class C sortase [Gulosibacter faecalis]
MAGRHLADTPVATRRWRPTWLTVAIILIAVTGLTVLTYPAAAQWLSSYNQSGILRDYEAIVDNAEPGAAEQLQLAHEYNAALTSGVELEANANVPTGSGSLADGTLEYDQILRADDSGLMARIKIDKIDVDMPIYHGTSDDTLMEGAGHLEGSSLPVGGTGTHSVITAHRGLANATMFSNLDQVGVGDTFTIEVFGEVLTYRVIETKVVEPEDTDSLRAVADNDLVTLVTCTPLGINTHRILVTGERVTPTPIADLEAAGANPDIPGFPWWAVLYAGGLAVAGIALWRMGLADARAAAKRAKQE